MAVDLVTVTGNIETLTGATPSLARIWFKLNRPDWNLSGDIFAPEYTEALADAGGAFSVALQSTAGLEAGASYTAILRYREPLDGKDREYTLSQFALPTGGPYQLGDLLSVPFVEPVPADILALAIAAQVAATEAAEDAQTAAALALAGSPYRLKAFAELASRLRYSGATGSQINVGAGDVVDVPGLGAYVVLVSGASGADLDYTGSGGVKLEVVNTNDIQAFGADGVGNESAQAIAAVAAKGSVHFSTPPSGTGKYEITDFIDGPFDNKTVSADPDVTVDFLGLFSETFGLTTFVNKLRTYIASSKNIYTIPPTPPFAYKSALAMPQVARQRTQRPIALATEVTPLQVATGTDTFSAATGSVSGQRYTITTTGAGSWRGGFVPLGPWQTLTGIIQAPEASRNIGVMIRGTTGYSIVYGDADTANYTLDRKPAGGALVSASIAWNQLGQTASNNSSPRNAVWSVQRIDAQRANVLINGQVLVEVAAIGDLFDAGFVVQANTATITIAGLCIDRRTDMLYGKTGMDRLFIFGDSTASAEPGSWAGYIPQLMDGLAGISLNAVPNYAVAGSLCASIATALTSQSPFAGASYVVVSGGTNDIAAQTTLATFETTVTNMCTTITSAGKKPVWILPWQYYGQAQTLAATGISGQGQNTVNYTLGAIYRAVIRRIVLNAGGIVVDPNNELPFPDPRYLQSRPEKPWLRDSIHQDAQAYQMYARMVAQAIVDDYCALPDSVSLALPAGSFLNGATIGTLRLNMTKDGLVHLSGSINVTTIADYTSILQLPRWALPVADVTVGATGVDGPSGVADAAWVNLSTAGVLLIVNVLAGSDLVCVDMTYKAAA